MDDVRGMLKSKRAQLLLQIEEIDALLRGLSRFLPDEMAPVTAGVEPSPPKPALEAEQPKTTPTDVKPQEGPPKPGGDLADVSAQIAAHRILEDAPKEFLHYTEIAERAINRGYKSNRAGEDIEAIGDY